MGDLTQLFRFFENWNPVVAALTAFITLATLIIVFVQLRVMRSQQNTMQDQTSLMQRQLSIVERQDELMRTQLARRPNLSVRVDVKRPDEEDENLRLNFFVTNGGDKTAQDLYWHLCLPANLTQENFIPHHGVGIRPTDRMHIEEVEYHHFAGR